MEMLDEKHEVGHHESISRTRLLVRGGRSVEAIVLPHPVYLMVLCQFA